MNKVSRNRLRSGFTLVEVMATTAIAGMVVVVVLGLTTQLSEQVQKSKARYPDRSWIANFKQQLEFDFGNCRSIVVDENKILMDGFAQLDLDGGLTAKRPVLIEYRLYGPAGTPSWLVRTEQRSTGNINHSRSSTPVCYGITRIIDRSGLEVDFPPASWQVTIEYLTEDQDLRTENWTLLRHGAF